MSSKKALPVIFLMGPTATGKTELAMALHETLPVDVINVDAAQVYRGLDIGTAKPSTEELERVPHRLIDIRDPSEPYSAADFCDDARKEIETIHQAGRIPLLVGGTIFYFHALEYGLSEMPAADAKIRERLLQQAEEIGWPAMHRRLLEVDPVSGQRIHPNDAQRVQRALEVFEISGHAMSALAADLPAQKMPWPVVKIALMAQEREPLRQRIATRFKYMLEAGFVKEVKALADSGELNRDLPAMRMVGYRQVLQYLNQEIPYNQMLETAIHATRQLAKRQMTWLRGYEDVHYLDYSNPDLETVCLRYLQGKLSSLGVY